MPPFRIVALFGFATMLCTSCNRQEVGNDENVVRPVRTAVVAESPNTITRTYPAVVLPAQQAELAFKVSGRVIELPIRASSEVKEGQAIAQLDRREFEAAVNRLTSQLEQANLQLAVMESGERTEVLAALQANVTAAEAQLETQRAQTDRIKNLFEQAAVARSEVETELARLASAEADLDVARQNLKKAEAGERDEVIEAQKAAIRGLEAELAQAKVDLEETTLRAPFDGVIASRNVDNFTRVQANGTVAVIQKLDTIDLQYDVPGVDVAIFGQNRNTVNVARLDVAPDREYEAELVEFGTQADAATQTFRGRVSIRYPEDVTVLPGMIGSVVVSVTLDEEAQLTIPESALAVELDGSSFVWVVDPQKKSVSKRKVTPLKLTGGDVAISDGLQPGEVVVTAGVSFLREGMQVNPIDTNAE